MIKVFTFFEDVSEDGGCTTVVPGSHRLTFDPRNAFEMVDLDAPPLGLTASAEEISITAQQMAAEHVDPYYHVQPQSASANTTVTTAWHPSVAMTDCLCFRISAERLQVCG